MKGTRVMVTQVVVGCVVVIVRSESEMHSVVGM